MAASVAEFDERRRAAPPLATAKTGMEIGLTLGADERKERPMTKPKAAPYRIVVGFDFSDTAESALAEAFVATAQRDHAELHVVNVVDQGHKHDLSETVEGMQKTLRQLAKERLHSWQQDHDGESFRVVIHVRVGPTADQIVALASEVSADLIVVGTHGRRGVKRLVMGSVAERVLRLAKTPLLVIRPKNYVPMEELPAPEPACEQCLAVRADSDGVKWWCAEHREPHDRPHQYSYTSVVSFQRHPGDML